MFVHQIHVWCTNTFILYIISCVIVIINYTTNNNNKMCVVVKKNMRWWAHDGWCSCYTIELVQYHKYSLTVALRIARALIRNSRIQNPQNSKKYLILLYWMYYYTSKYWRTVLTMWDWPGGWKVWLRIPYPGQLEYGYLYFIIILYGLPGAHWAMLHLAPRDFLHHTSVYIE